MNDDSNDLSFDSYSPQFVMNCADLYARETGEVLGGSSMAINRQSGAIAYSSSPLLQADVAHEAMLRLGIDEQFHTVERAAFYLHCWKLWLGVCLFWQCKASSMDGVQVVLRVLQHGLDELTEFIASMKRLEPSQNVSDWAMLTFDFFQTTYKGEFCEWDKAGMATLHALITDSKRVSKQIQ